MAGARANDLPGAVAEEVKRERWERLMAAQQAISAARLQEKVGRTLEALIDAVTEEGATGRSRGDAPDIDGQGYGLISL